MGISNIGFLPPIIMGNKSAANTLANPLTATLKSTPPAPSAPSGRIVKELNNLKELAGRTSGAVGTVQEYLDRLSAIARQATSGSIDNTARSRLDKKFQTLNAQLQHFASKASFEGQKLFDGNFAKDAGAIVGKLIFTGADNQPTKDQATLSLGNILKDTANLSVADMNSAAVAFSAIDAASGLAKAAKQETADFSATITFANNTLRGIPNRGPSITQVNVLNQASDIASAAKEKLAAIESLVVQLRNTAKQAASGDKTDIDRAYAQQRFEGLLMQIDSLALQAGLDGKLKYDLSPTLDKYLYTGARGQPTPEQASLRVGDLSVKGLFGDARPDVLTQVNAVTAMAALDIAAKKLAQAKTELAGFSKAIDFVRHGFDVGSFEGRAFAGSINVIA